MKHGNFDVTGIESKPRQSLPPTDWSNGLRPPKLTPGYVCFALCAPVVGLALGVARAAIIVTVDRVISTYVSQIENCLLPVVFL